MNSCQEEDKTYTVYMHVNKFDGKRYVGQTSNIQDRWRKNGTRYFGSVFGDVIEEVGWDNFEHIIVKEGLTHKEALQLEIDTIKKYKSNNPEYGYNISAGGYGYSSHFMTETRLYRLWCKMKERCYLSSCEAYKQNGLLGIKVCDEWIHDFKAFYQWAVNNGYEENLVLFRKNKQLDYSPSNCYWTTERDRAERRDSTVFYEFNGKSQTLYKWSKEVGISEDTLRRRIFTLNMPVEEALTRPVQSKKMITYNGESHSITEWSRITGVSGRNIYLRIKRGWPIDQVFDKRKHNKNREPIENVM